MAEPSAETSVNPNEVPAERWVEALSAEIMQRRRPDRPLVVGITGVDTSGKTELTAALTPHLGPAVTVVHVDDFHRPQAQRYRTDLPPHEAYAHWSFDFDRLRHEVLEPLHRRGSVDVHLRLLDLASDSWTLERRYQAAPGDVVVVEGVFLLRADVRDLLDLVVYLHVDEAEVLRRGRIRDVPSQGEEVIAKYHSKYLPAQRRYLRDNPPVAFADVVVDNTQWVRPQVHAWFGRGGSWLPSRHPAPAAAIVFDLWQTLALLPGQAKRDTFEATAAALGEDPNEFDPHWCAGRIQRETGDLTRYLADLGASMGRRWDQSRLAEAVRVRTQMHGELVRRGAQTALPVLHALRDRGLSLGLISNCSSDMRDHLRTSGLADVFDTVVLSCDAGWLKPDPRLFRLAAARLGTPPDRCLYVGDGHDHELAGAARVGMRPILLDRGDGHRWSGPRVHDLGTVLDLVSGWEA